MCVHQRKINKPIRTMILHSKRMQCVKEQIIKIIVLYADSRVWTLHLFTSIAICVFMVNKRRENEVLLLLLSFCFVHFASLRTRQSVKYRIIFLWIKPVTKSICTKKVHREKEKRERGRQRWWNNRSILSVWVWLFLCAMYAYDFVRLLLLLLPIYFILFY